MTKISLLTELKTCLFVIDGIAPRYIFKDSVARDVPPCFLTASNYRLPYKWYLDSHGAEVRSATSA